MTDSKIFFPEKPTADPRIYAYSIADGAHEGLLKVGQTTRDVKSRIEEQLKTALVKNYRIELEESAERADGTVFTDHEVRRRLVDKGFHNVDLEWMHCGLADVQTAITELRHSQPLTGTHHLTFGLRPEQAQAVKETAAYFESIWAEPGHEPPRFLWNAKMRFGKTFTTYKLVQALARNLVAAAEKTGASKETLRRLAASRVLVLTFKPAVEGAWREDLESHADFDGWQYFSRRTDTDPTKADQDRPLVYFGSFQDVLGKDTLGNIKPKNTWIHEINWDLVVFDEYHFGAWRDRAKELFEGDDAESDLAAEIKAEAGSTGLDVFAEQLENLNGNESEFLPITTRAYLYLSGTPFRMLASGEFIEEQIFNWTYSDEQRAKRDWASSSEPNPYAALPELVLLTYQMPDEIIAIASKGEFDEFDLGEFFKATGTGANAAFKHKEEVQKWLNIIRGAYAPTQIDNLKLGASKPPFPYSDTRLLPYLNHSLWYLPSVAACFAMANLLGEKQNVFFHDYQVLTVAGTGAGIGLAALPPVKQAIGSGFESKTITLTCGKLTTGVTVPQWSSILMLTNLNSPETYFQAAFRVQSPWAIRNPNGDNPNETEILKPVCYVFDFAPTRALRQIAEYGIRLSPHETNPEAAVGELVNQFLPVLAYDGSHMRQIDAAGVLDWAMAGTTATMLAKKWESALLVNVDNETLKRIMSDEAAMAAIMNIEGFRSLGSDLFETVINKSEAVKKAKAAAAESGDVVDKKEKKELTDEEKEYQSKRKQIQQKLIKFATRIPAFMYLTDFRENTLYDVITRLDTALFRSVTGLTLQDFNLLVKLGVFNGPLMNQAVFQFRRYEDASLAYTGVVSRPELARRAHGNPTGAWDTVITAEETK